MVLDGVSTSLSDLTEKEARFASGEYYSYAKDDRLKWGVHKIVEEKIQFELLQHMRGVRPECFLYSGKILNDTTFEITKFLIRGDVRYPKMAADTFHFKQFSPKPDSTNAFIPID